ncbi:hypothetical protein TSUD_267910 [Trifolium subterraneum]|uniref:Uncharacterized protein n=1 Tax=Trifolium subterraneum TaxID=3900 RepID=A0A2Z6NKU1_TRISU|nr:hypothetical protein TSUD_267910 [Trifolium subterraneum]
MAMQPHSHGNNGFPFCINGYCSGGLAELQQSQHPQQQQQQKQQQQQQHQQQPPPPQHHYQLQGQVVPIPIFVSLFEKQRQQTNQLINTQNTQMNLMLQQHQRELQATAIKSMGIYSQQVMARKNEEITKAEKKMKEMENILRSLELEKRELKKISEEKGAIAIALRNKLEEEKKKKRLRMPVANDVESCCGENEESRAKKHLSSCKVCETLLQACPICGMAKKGVIEIQNLDSN